LTLSAVSPAETIAAINRAIITGLERNLAGSAAFRANGIIHLALAAVAAGVPFAGIPAGLAPLRFVGEPSLSIKFLFLRGENEFLATVYANECFVLIHK
jgi:hypothetical protein